MKTRYNELLSGAEKDDMEASYFPNVNAGQSVRFPAWMLESSEKMFVIEEEKLRRDVRRFYSDEPAPEYVGNLLMVKADCSVWYDSPEADRESGLNADGCTAVFTDVGGNPHQVWGLPKDFNPESCLFTLERAVTKDSLTKELRGVGNLFSSKAVKGITVEHYDDKGQIDDIWRLEKSADGSFVRRDFSKESKNLVMAQKNARIANGTAMPFGKWPVLKEEGKEFMREKGAFIMQNQLDRELSHIEPELQKTTDEAKREMLMMRKLRTTAFRDSFNTGQNKAENKTAVNVSEPEYKKGLNVIAKGKTARPQETENTASKQNLITKLKMSLFGKKQGR